MMMSTRAMRVHRGPIAAPLFAPFFALLGAFWVPAAHAAFDHRHGAWEVVLKQHVAVAPGGVASAVRYASIKAQPEALQNHIASLSCVSPQEYASWSRPDQVAFLINDWALNDAR